MGQVVHCLRQPTHPGLRQYHERCREVVAEVREPGKVMIFSDESFTAGRRLVKQKQAELFENFFGEFRMLLTLREPLSQMESLYLQELKAYNMRPENHPRLIKRFGAPPRFFSAEEWLDANWSFPNHGLFSHLNVAETAEFYAEVVGKDNVLIQIYEEMKKDNIGYIRHLSQVIGIDSDESQQLCEN
ncbi:MAG TPA: hypothetical protein VLA12_01475, partial [Planctomycetaceae bacterium]|nr:hypothetical protein [Planctomycetaceae bacterium]